MYGPKVHPGCWDGFTADKTKRCHWCFKEVEASSDLKQPAGLAPGGASGPTMGEGSFGTVYEGTLRGETAVAIKTMRVEKVTPSVVRKFRAEIIASEISDAVLCCDFSLTVFLFSTSVHRSWRL